MVLATFNIPSEIRERLKQEPNQSELVTNLLSQFFVNLSEKDLKQKINLIEERRKMMNKTFDIEENKIKRQVEVKEKETEEVIKQEKLIRTREESSLKLRKEIEKEIEKQNKHGKKIQRN